MDWLSVLYVVIIPSVLAVVCLVKILSLFESKGFTRMDYLKIFVLLVLLKVLSTPATMVANRVLRNLGW
jgi:hypothetical protein